MKKHILGFTIFAAIIVSSAFIHALVAVPGIPQADEVRQPQNEPAKRRKCPKKPKDLSYDVLSSEYFYEEGTLVTTLRVRWEGWGPAPSTIYAGTELFTLDRYAQSESLGRELIRPEFVNDRAIVTITSDVDAPFARGRNLYAAFDLSDDRSGDSYIDESRKLAEAKQVTFVHGESSVINPRTVR